MTTNEAKQQIEISERQIVNAYEVFKNDAKELGNSTVKVASGTTTRRTLLPLLLALMGLLFCFGEILAAGIPMMVIGIFLAVLLRGPAKRVRDTTERLQRDLNSVIERNNRI